MTKKNRDVIKHAISVLRSIADEHDAVVGSPLGGTLLREAARLQAVLDDEPVTPEPEPKFFDTLGWNDGDE